MKNNTKLLLLTLSALVAAPNLAQAQTVPVRVAKAPRVPMPNPQELLNDLFVPYTAAKTFQGKMSISAQSAPLKMELGFSEMQLKTRYRFNSKGDLQSEDTTLIFDRPNNSNQRSEIHFVRDSVTTVAILPDRKVWWKEGKALMSQPLYSNWLSALTDKVSAVVEEGNIKPAVSRGVDAGIPVFILKVKLGGGVRAVVDQQTRALRSFDLKDVFSIRCFEQTFNEPLTDESFNWTPPADYKQIEESESLAFYPDFLRALLEKPGTAKPASTMSGGATPMN